MPIQEITDNLVECDKCGWCYFGVTEAYVKAWENDWVIFWEKLDEEGRANYGCLMAPPTRETEYLKCGRCGNPHRENFFLSKKTLMGSTISGIMLTPDQEKEWIKS